MLLGSMHASSQLAGMAPSMKCCTEDSKKSVLDTLKNDKRFTKLMDALKESQGLTDDLTSGKDITFLAPTNQAFEAIERDMKSMTGKKGEMDSILRYHCIESKVEFKDFEDGQTWTTRMKLKQLNDKHQRIRVFKCAHTGTVSLNMFTRIQEYDMKASNGVIHVIDRVLLPPTDVLETLDFVPSKFSIWLLAVERTEMRKTLEETAGLTVLVPTNGAWENLGYSALAYLFSEHGKKDLKRIVEYHMSKTLVYADMVIEKKHVSMESMLKGEKIEWNVEEMKKGERSFMNFGWEKMSDKHHEGKINPNCTRILLNRGESRVTLTDILCENGNMFLISNVMIPEGVCTEK